MDMIKSVMVRNIKALRDSKGWNQEDLAEKTGFSVGTIKNIERGKTWVSPETLEAICLAFDISYDKLFSTNGDGKMFDMPMSKAIRRLMAIPDDIYEMAQEFGPQDEMWEDVRGVLDHHIEKKNLAKNDEKQA
jgi:transcriptional regulator with XRE-family HTH domain